MVNKKFYHSWALPHLITWFVLLGIPLLFTSIKFPGWNAVLTYLASMIAYVAVFYLFYYAVYRFYDDTRRWGQTLLHVALIFVFQFYTVHLLIYKFIPAYLNPYMRGFELPVYSREYISDNLTNFLQYMLFAFVLFLFYKFVFVQREKMRLANEKLKTEYDYLKTQINPHFLYNTLDYFYAGALRYDKKQAEGIGTLSEIMRYSLAAGNVNGRVPVAEELAQVENYISLQQLRFNNTLQVVFTKPDLQDDRITMIPHLFITLVENAFKYGVTNDPAHPLRITMEMQGQEIVCKVHNKKSGRVTDEGGTGIGLENLKQRLQLEYPGRHRYTVHQSATDYEVQLILPC
jgi:two-component system, LytTR family, sensor kinase